VFVQLRVLPFFARVKFDTSEFGDDFQLVVQRGDFTHSFWIAHVLFVQSVTGRSVRSTSRRQSTDITQKTNHVVVQ
jgi:hypothetical protein